MTSYTAAVVQMNSQPDVDLNFESARKWIRSAAQQGAKFVGLPEYFSFLGDLRERQQKAGEISKRSSQFLKDTAAEFSIYLLGGTIPVPADQKRTYNYRRYTTTFRKYINISRNKEYNSGQN